MKKLIVLVAIFSWSASASFAQQVPVVEDLSTPIVKPLKLSGPRIGISYVPQIDRFGLGETFGDSTFRPDPFITQFGWQFEWRYFETRTGDQGLFEIIPLIGGLDQGLILPSLNMIVGFRNAEGFEFGAGPNINMMDPGFTFALGHNFSSGYMNFPVNAGFTRGKEGWRFSLLVGFNKRDTR